MDNYNPNRNLTNLKFDLLSGNFDDEDIYSMLSEAIEENNLDNKEMRAIILIIKENYYDELSIFNKTIINLIDNKFLFDNIRQSFRDRLNNDCNCNNNPDPNNKSNSVAPRFVKEVSYIGDKKVITTYENLPDGSRREQNREVVEKPDIDSIFVNILGNKFLEEDNSAKIIEHDEPKN